MPNTFLCYSILNFSSSDLGLDPDVGLHQCLLVKVVFLQNMLGEKWVFVIFHLIPLIAHSLITVVNNRAQMSLHILCLLLLFVKIRFLNMVRKTWENIIHVSCVPDPCHFEPDPDPYPWGPVHWITDSDLDPDPALFLRCFQETNKKKFFFCLLLTGGTFPSVFKDSKTLKSHKQLKIKVFKIVFPYWWKNPDPDLGLGGPKTYVSDSGSGTRHVRYLHFASVFR